MLSVCYRHVWLLWRSLISKKYAKFIFFFQFYTQKKKRLFCKMYIDATPALIDFCDSAFERRIMCFWFVISIFCFYVCRLLQKMWKVFVFFSIYAQKTKKMLFTKKNIGSMLAPIGTCDSAFKRHTNLLSICHRHIWLLRKSLTTKKC